MNLKEAKIELAKRDEVIEKLVEVIEPLCLALDEHLGYRYYPNGVGNFVDLIHRTEKALAFKKERLG